MKSETEIVPFRSVVLSAIGGGWGDETQQEGFVKVAVVRGTDFFSASHAEINNVPIRFETVNKVAKRTLESGDLLIEISGGSKNSNQPTGRSLLIQKRFLDKFNCPVIPASFCRLIRLNRDVIEPAFAYYCLQEMYKSRRVEGYEHHSTGISNFQFEYFLDAELIPLPPLPEQRAIARILGSLDDKIELNRRTNATLESLAQTLFRAWFVDFEPVKANASGVLQVGMDAQTAALFPDSFEPSNQAWSTPGLIPKGWEVGSLSDIANFVSGNRPEDRSPIRTNETPFPLYGGGGIMGFVKEPLFSTSLVITGRVGTLGLVFRVMSPCWPSDNTVVMLPKKQALLEFLFLSALGVDYSSLNRGSTQPLVTQGDLKKQRVILPSEKIVNEFHRLTSSLFMQIDQNEKQSQTLAQLRDALLPRLISGRLRVPEAMRHVEAKTGVLQ